MGPGGALEIFGVVVNVSLYLYCLCDLHVHIGCFLIPSVVGIELLP